MLRRHILMAFLVLVTWNAFAQLPDTVYVGGQQMHVQGLALDKAHSRMYFSFTDKFISTDLQGKVLGSIDAIEGHLGAMTFDASTGLVYASLECKDDEIGAGIARSHGVESYSAESSSFYIAVIDPDSMSLSRVPVEEACADYKAPGHRYGCSGIDGVSIAPAPGHRGGRSYLYVAYGIYGDSSRDDNDDQILLCYDTSSWELVDKIFIRTGNTRYGVQNLAYDPLTHTMYMAVYPGSKPQYPNYSLFSVDWTRRPDRADGVTRMEMTSGWHYPWGSTGLCPVAHGLWYFSHNGRGSSDGRQFCKACLVRLKDELKALGEE